MKNLSSIILAVAMLVGTSLTFMAFNAEKMPPIEQPPNSVVEVPYSAKELYSYNRILEIDSLQTLLQHEKDSLLTIYLGDMHHSIERASNYTPEHPVTRWVLADKSERSYTGHPAKKGIKHRTGVEHQTSRADSTTKGSFASDTAATAIGHARTFPLPQGTEEPHSVVSERYHRYSPIFHRFIDWFS